MIKENRSSGIGPLLFEYLSIRNGNVTVLMQYHSEYGHVLYHCGFDVILGITARNDGEQASEEFVLEVRVEGFGDSIAICVPEIAPQCITSIQCPAGIIDAGMLKKQIAVVTANFRVRVPGKPSIGTVGTIIILGCWDWPNRVSLLKAAAAFVLPLDPIVESIVIQAQNLMENGMESRGAANSFHMLLKSGSADMERHIVKVLYEFLSGSLGMQYAEPLTTPGPDGRTVYQTIKPPGRIFNLYPFDRSGNGTCLDLALLMAGCLENAGLHPVLFFVSDGGDVLRHAFCGCWIGTGHGMRPLIDDTGYMLREIECGRILPLEITGVSAGIRAGRTKAGFDEAVRMAVDQIKSTSSVFMADIGALWPPYGCVRPADHSYEPEVVRIYEEARLFARYKHYENIEATHLLYALFAVQGHVTVWLCGEIGLNPDEIRLKLDNSVFARQYGKEPGMTVNYSKCLAYAEKYANMLGAPSVREQDVWWAVLTSGSVAVEKRCKALIIPLDTIEKKLYERFPIPCKIEETDSSLFEDVDI